MSKIHYEVHLQGRVQAVGFRYNAKEQADKIGIYGYARNLKDGSVILELEGTREVIEQFLDWCKTGSYRSNIEQIDFEEKDVEGYREFSVF